MGYADEQSYEEMITALNNFMSQTEEQCAVMEQAAIDCVDNTDNDPAAMKSQERLSKCVGNIRGTFGTIQSIIRALQEELEAIREAAAKANQMD